MGKVRFRTVRHNYGYYLYAVNETAPHTRRSCSEMKQNKKKTVDIRHVLVTVENDGAITL